MRMMSRVAKTLSIGAALALGACAVHPDPARVASLNALVGKPETDLVRAMGVPSRTYDAGGHRFLAYRQSRIETIPGDPGWGPWGYPWGWGGGWGGWGWGGFPPEIVQRDCETTFDLLNGVVQAWTLRGNAC